MDSCVGKHEQKDHDNCKKSKSSVMWTPFIESSEIIIQPATNLMSIKLVRLKHILTDSAFTVNCSSVYVCHCFGILT